MVFEPANSQNAYWMLMGDQGLCYHRLVTRRETRLSVGQAVDSKNIEQQKKKKLSRQYILLELCDWLLVGWRTQGWISHQASSCIHMREQASEYLMHRLAQHPYHFAHTIDSYHSKLKVTISSFLYLA